MGAGQYGNMQANKFTKDSKAKKHLLFCNLDQISEVVILDFDDHKTLYDIRDQLLKKLNAKTVELFVDNQKIPEKDLANRINFYYTSQIYSNSQLQYRAELKKLIKIQEIPYVQEFKSQGQEVEDELIRFDQIEANQINQLKNQLINQHIKHKKILADKDIEIQQLKSQIDEIKQNQLQKTQIIMQQTQKFKQQQQEQKFAETKQFFVNDCGHYVDQKQIEEMVLKSLSTNQQALCQQCKPKLSLKLIEKACPHLGNIYLQNLFSQQEQLLQDNIELENNLTIARCQTKNCYFFCIWNDRIENQKQFDYFCPMCLIFSVRKC